MLDIGYLYNDDIKIFMKVMIENIQKIIENLSHLNNLFVVSIDPYVFVLRKRSFISDFIKSYESF